MIMEMRTRLVLIRPVGLRPPGSDPEIEKPQRRFKMIQQTKSVTNNPKGDFTYGSKYEHFSA